MQSLSGLFHDTWRRGRLLIPPLQHSRSVVHLTRVKYADNNENSTKVTILDRPYVIAFLQSKKKGKLGDVIRIAHRGKVHRAIIVSNKYPSNKLPIYDYWYVILVNEKLEPLGTRITIPLPSVLRQGRFKNSKIMALATRYI